MLTLQPSIISHHVTRLNSANTRPVRSVSCRKTTRDPRGQDRDPTPNLRGVLCGLCRAVRCCAALSLSSLSTTSSGRLAVLVVITTLVVGGPVCNVCVNLRAMSSGLACGLQLGRNQSALMTSSMNTLTTRLTSAVSGTTVRVLSTVVAGWEKKWQLPRVLPQIFSYRKFVRIFLSCGKLFFQKM